MSAADWSRIETAVEPVMDRLAALIEAFVAAGVAMDLPSGMRLLNGDLDLHLHPARAHTATPPTASQCATPAPIVYRPPRTFADLRGFLEEQPTGRCTLATLALQIIVLGPAATDGTRATLFDRSYEQSVGTQVSRAPLPIPELYGRMLHDALARALAELDRSNVTRSGLPLVDLSAPQAKPTAPQAK